MSVTDCLCDLSWEEQLITQTHTYKMLHWNFRGPFVTPEKYVACLYDYKYWLGNFRPSVMLLQNRARTVNSSVSSLWNAREIDSDRENTMLRKSSDCPKMVTGETYFAINVRHNIRHFSVSLFLPVTASLNVWGLLQVGGGRLGGVHDRLHIYPLCGIFLLPLA